MILLVLSNLKVREGEGHWLPVTVGRKLHLPKKILAGH